MNFHDRDLSWLSFNYRILLEAKDTTVPPFERLKFAAIFSSNLDEFFRVRVADIRNIIQIDKKKINERIDFHPSDLLKDIHSEVSHQLNTFGEALQEILEALKAHDIEIVCDHNEIPSELKRELLRYFKTEVSSYLKIIPLSEIDELFLDNQAIYLAVKLADKLSYVINIPTDKLPRFYQGKLGEKTYYIYLDDIIRIHLDLIFKGRAVEDCSSVKLNKNADLNIDDEYEGDLAKKIAKQIQKRNLGIPSRFLFDMKISEALLKEVTAKLTVTDEDLVTGGRYHNLNDFFQIAGNHPQLTYGHQLPIAVDFLEKSTSIFSEVEREDILLHFPYQSYDYILQFFNEAALDPEVTKIYVTFYRMAEKSHIAEALISAAVNGKEVVVFMEVKARFDEANNLQWAERMNAAGVKIIYSLPGLKVHAKVALVIKKDKRYGFFGTGNLNEKTSELYCDHGLLSTHEAMTSDLFKVFEFLSDGVQPEGFEHLIVSQFNAMDRFLGLIDREIEHAKAGRKASMTIKVNNLQEKKLISKVHEAAEEGVEVRMLVRSICCLVSNDKLKIKRIVGRYLEHARVFHFHNDGNEELYLGSSDWMNRNLHRRVEVSFPVYSEKGKKELAKILDLQWTDDVKGVWVDQNLNNIKLASSKGSPAQDAIYAYLKTTTS